MLCLDPVRRQILVWKIREVERDSLASGYEDLIDGLQLPDPDDRHVLATAIQKRASVIVTRDTTGLGTHPKERFAPQDIPHLASLVRLLAFEISDDRCLDASLRDALFCPTTSAFAQSAARTTAISTLIVPTGLSATSTAFAGASVTCSPRGRTSLLTHGSATNKRSVSTARSSRFDCVIAKMLQKTRRQQVLLGRCHGGRRLGFFVRQK